MSLRTILVLALLALCGACGSGNSNSNEPQTAKEKQALEEKDEGANANSRKWGGWRYKGDRNDCFFVVGRNCFKTEALACANAKCKAPKKCASTGAGPATVSCK